MKTSKGKNSLFRQSSLFGLTALLTLASCSQKPAPAAEVVAVPSNGGIVQKLGAGVATNGVNVAWTPQSVAAGNYLSVPVTIESLKEIKAVDLQFTDLPIGVDLVGVQDEEGLFGRVASLEGSRTEQATVFFDAATKKHTVNFVFKVDAAQGFTLQSKVNAVVNADGSAVPVTYSSSQNFTIGEGGQSAQPKLSDLQERIQQASAQSGEIQVQAYPGIYKVPTVIQKEWKDFEPGDLNQDHRVDVADEVVLIGFLLKNSTPTPYQLYAADLDETLENGEKVINGNDYWAAVAKSNLTTLKIVKEKPFVQPLAVKANEPNPAIVLAGNAGYGPVVLKVEPSEPWITVTEIPTNVTTHAYEVRTNAPEGSKGFITVTYSNGEKRQVDVTALAPPAAPAVPPTVVGGTPGEFTGIGGQFTLVMVLEDKDGKPITDMLATENFTFKDVTLAPTATPTEIFTTGEAVPVKVENGGKVESGPVSMMIAIDQSGSMSSNDPKNLRYTAATELIGTLKNPDEVGVMSLDTVTQKLTQDYTLAKQAVNRGGGSSDIYGGVRIGVKELASAQHTHKAIVALTDGETSLGNFEASIKEANDARVNVYTVGLGNKLNYKELQDLASRTGGAFAHVQNANDLQNVFNAIGRSIQQGGTRVTGQVKLNQGISKVGTYILSGTVVTTVRGQTFETPFSVRVYVDGQSVIALPPVVQSLSPKTGSTKGGVAVVIRGTDLSRVNKVMFGAVPATNFTVNSATQITAITPAQAPGDVQVTVESPEGTSNVSTYTYVNQAPSIGSLRVSKASPLINEEVTFSFSVSDNDGNPTSCVLDFGDGQTQELASCSGNQTVKHTYAAAGSFTAKLTVKDAPGATSTRNVAVRVLATPPNTPPKIASLTANPASPVAGTATAIGFTVSDAENDAVSCVVDFGDGQIQNLTSCAGVQNLSHTYEKEGRYTIKVTAKDAAGSSQQTAVVTVQPKPLNQAPVINAFAATPTSPVAGQQVSFSLNISDPENDAVSCTVDFGDGQTQNLTSCAGVQNLTHTYAADGQYTAQVTAKDATGSVQKTFAVTVQPKPVTVNTPPVISNFSTTPSDPKVGEEVTFNFSVSDAEGDDVSCTVDFGDGETQEVTSCAGVQSVSHFYTIPRSYDISVQTHPGGSAIERRFEVAESLDKPSPSNEFIRDETLSIVNSSELANDTEYGNLSYEVIESGDFRIISTLQSGIIDNFEGYSSLIALKGDSIIYWLDYHYNSSTNEIYLEDRISQGSFMVNDYTEPNKIVEGMQEAAITSALIDSGFSQELVTQSVLPCGQELSDYRKKFELAFWGQALLPSWQTYIIESVSVYATSKVGVVSLSLMLDTMTFSGISLQYSSVFAYQDALQCLSNSNIKYDKQAVAIMGPMLPMSTIAFVKSVPDGYNLASGDLTKDSRYNILKSAVGNAIAILEENTGGKYFVDFPMIDLRSQTVWLRKRYAK